VALGFTFLSIHTGVLTNFTFKSFYKMENETKPEITRLEVINHAKNDYPVGRILTLYQELGDFKSIELSYQDGKRTLKIFLN